MKHREATEQRGWKMGGRGGLHYDAQVKVLLGEGIYRALLTAVDEGIIDQTIAGLIAEQLHPTVRGNFHRQVSSDKGYVFSRTHFREILSDWYMYSAFDLKHDEAVKWLIRALKHDNLGMTKKYKNG